MTNAPYWHSATHSMTQLLRAMEEAKATLPPSVIRYHAVFARRELSPWEQTSHWYRMQEQANPDALETLTDLCLMEQALACFVTLTTETVSAQPPDFRLAKRRRSA